MKTNTILLEIIAVASTITAINTIIITKNLAARKLFDEGITLLLEKNYQDAIKKFDELSSIKSIANNKGLYYKAFTLLSRNGKSDKAKAIELMKKIVDKKLGCYAKAKEYLQEAII